VTSLYTRYPGAQPFADNAISRAVFFGREKESTALTDQILANRLVVVYAKSGLGKTSLLQSGVAQPLRDDGCLPLFVRVNDMKQGPFLSVLDGVQNSALRQHVEYSPGSELSLWHFFKTAEFWLSDCLLTPILLLDQFEELFTLHAPQTRAGFLRELGHLIRGIRPEIAAVSAPIESLNDAAPELRVVISLREDYLGSLEEAADNIPQILDHRFRLTPLTTSAATEALQGPARVQDQRLATRPFAYRPETIQSILAYLTRRTRGSSVRASNYVEPFHLQLICQRVEALVADRQGQGANEVEITLDDLGGEQGLKATLRDFYRNVINAIQPGRTRKRVRRLCEQYLISPEGRRLSLEGGEIKRILKLARETLSHLVDCRLLRSDQRAESWYYELSHDALVAPILATRKPQGITLGLLGLIGSLMLGLIAISCLFIPVGFFIFWVIDREQSPEGTIGALVAISLFVLPFSLLSLWMCIIGLRRSVESLNRYISAPT
jgi:hypothetical protein